MAEKRKKNKPREEGGGPAEFERKRWSEEARLERCPECGSLNGHHLIVCSRKKPS